MLFGGLKGEISYDDQAFGIDSDIQQMFCGPDHGQPDEARAWADRVLLNLGRDFILDASR